MWKLGEFLAFLLIYSLPPVMIMMLLADGLLGGSSESQPGTDIKTLENLSAFAFFFETNELHFMVILLLS